ncbi:MAG: ATP-binding protein [Pyrinomonadaceae bacterium]
MALTFERKLPIILFFVFLMLTTIGFVFYQNTQSMQEAIAWEKHTKDISFRLDDTTAMALEMQNAMTGFILTGNDTYLDPFNRAKPKVDQNIEQLRRLTVNFAAQTDEINRLEALLKNYVAGVSERVDYRKSHGFEDSAHLMAWQEGKGLMSEIRSSVGRIKGAETALLERREQKLDSRLSWTIRILIVSSIAGIISLALANLIVLSESRKRRVAQRDLIAANEGLERNIEQRTVELQDANVKLKEIAGEREIILINEKSARKEAEIANRLRDEFMATVSHELRTPLNSILGWARLMKGGALDDTQSKKALNTIIKNSETQNRLIEDLLDVARVISGKLQLDLVDIDPVELVSNSIETVRPLAAAKHINIEMTVEKNKSVLSIRGDRHRLMQIFTNLLTNAIKFSPDGSPISVSMSFADEAVTTNIVDTGKGISAEFLPLVFERFRQDATHQSKNGGLGLGLAIVRNLVEIHGGSVRAESLGENKGSTFTVILPASGDRTSIQDEHLDGIQKIDGNNIG